MAKSFLIKGLLNKIYILIILQNLTIAQTIFPNKDIEVPNYGTCRMPDKEQGLCKAIKDCKVLYDMWLKSPLKDSEKLYLSRSQCGYNNCTVLVCCPIRHRRVASTSVLPSPTPNNVIKLLPKPGECGNAISIRIYGGNKTKIDEYPWMALLEYTKANNTKGHHCGGSLINSRYVITASHCVKSLPRNWVLTGVRLGEWNTTTNPDCAIDIRGEKDCAPQHIDVRIARVIPHPEYNPRSLNKANDIALIRLERNISYTYFISPICLPINKNLRTSVFNGTIMEIAGWGKTEKASASNLKLKASVEVFNSTKCRSMYKRNNIILEDTHICAGGKDGIDACMGDSGGSLISVATTKSTRVRPYYFLAGIVSFGPTPCGLEGWPGVFTHVGSYMEWLMQNIQP